MSQHHDPHCDNMNEAQLELHKRSLFKEASDMESKIMAISAEYIVGKGSNRHQRYYERYFRREMKAKMDIRAHGWWDEYIALSKG